MRRRLRWSGVLVAALLAAPGTGGQAGAQGFPHARHEGLFPDGCATCHGGDAAVPEIGEFPEPAWCRACHDGDRLRVVAWQGRVGEPSMLVFSHADHAAALARRSRPLACRGCHGVGDATGAMAVAAAAPAACMGCHDRDGRGHLAMDGVRCARCHPPLTANDGLSAARLAALPQPEGHEGNAWIPTHGSAADASCAVCHARESCERCHLNGAALPAVRVLDPDPRVAAVVAELPPRYPAPPGHAADAWRWRHGEEAATDGVACSNCHTRASCRACHAEGRLPELAALPEAAPGDRRGVQVASRSSDVHAFDFVRSHGVDAASAGTRCTACHDASTCTSCHASATAPAFHEDNFVARHGSEAFAADTRCTSCHNTELFCRACHRTAGAAGGSDGLAVFHDREPFWLIGHGQAARQGLETCATCHTQSSCATCHSPLGGWGVSPHGPGFDARRAADANPLLCRRCHPGAP